jgi:predicted transcriptional regulator
LIARELVKEHNFSQTKAARKIGTTQAAVSQYMYLKRGKRYEPMRSMRRVASRIAKGIAKGELSTLDIITQFCDVCRELRGRGMLCRSHRGITPLPRSCDICPKGL